MLLRCPAQEYGIAGYTLLMSLIEYKTLVMRDDFEGASAILPTIPQVSILELPCCLCHVCMHHGHCICRDLEDSTV